MVGEVGGWGEGEEMGWEVEGEGVEFGVDLGGESREFTIFLPILKCRISVERWYRRERER